LGGLAAPLDVGRSLRFVLKSVAPKQKQQEQEKLQDELVAIWDQFLIHK